jgi:uncharacterized membrane protein YeaQ/YmgE (transglycosylase-associated protein family)
MGSKSLIGRVSEPQNGCHFCWKRSKEITMAIIWAIIIGFIVGIIAKFIVHGNAEPRGFIWTVVIGIVGSLLATWIGQAIGWYQPGESAGWIASIVGAVILLLIYGAVARGTRRRA